jgi:hypothetical protein
MDADEIRKFCHAEPFKPFGMKLRDGRIVVVQESWYIAFPPDSGRAYVVYPDDRREFIELDEIVAIVPSPRGGSHAQRRRKAS